MENCEVVNLKCFVFNQLELVEKVILNPLENKYYGAALEISAARISG